jgi:hypothetical protein
MLMHYGVQSGLRQARKHLGWYLDRHVPMVGRSLRQQLMTSFDPAEVIRLLQNVLVDPANERAAA